MSAEAGPSTGAVDRAIPERMDLCRMALAAARLGTFEWDLATNAVTLDERSREIWGLGPSEGRDVEEMFAHIHPEDVAHARATGRAAVASAERLETEFRILRPDGAVRTVLSLSDMRPGANGAPERRVGVFQDVTGRRAAEEARRQGEAFTASLLESSTDCIKVLDEEGRILSANTPGLASLEVDDFEVIRGAEYAGFHPGEGAAAVRAAVAEALAGRTGRYFGRAPTAKGRWGWWEVTTTPIATAPDEPRRVLAVTREVTERHRALEELRDSEARFRLMADAVPQIVWITDPEGRVEFFNKQWANYTGASYDPATAAEVTASFVHPEDGAATMAAFDRARAAGGPFLVEHRIRSRTGDYRWFLVRAEPHRDPHTGAVLRWFGASVDIHDRREAEAALRESEARLQAIANSIDQMVWSTRPDGFHDYYNQRWYDYTGVPSGSTDGEGWNGVFHPEDQERAWAVWSRSLETGEPYHIEYRLRHRSGQYRWVLGRAQPVRDAEGRITRWFGTCTDIQDIVEARDVLARSRAELEHLIEERTAERDRAWQISQDLLAAVAPDGVIMALNASWTRLLGWDTSESIGRPFAELTHPDDLEETLRVFRSVFAAPLSTPYEFRLRHKDGSYRWFAWTAAFEDSRVYASGRDVTADKERQAELEAAQEQLRQSQKMEAMGQLTGGVAHDFNNLLTPIVASLDMLLRRGLGSERERRLMDGALQSAERAKVLVQRLLAFARRQPLQPGPVDLGTLVTGMAELIASTTGPRIDLRVELPDDLPPVLADANQLEMALLNLAVNARDAMPDVGVLTISAARDSVRRPHPAKLRHGHYVRLSVQDTGTGMDAATLARAVEPFFSTKGIGKGTGLGLSMVHGLASQLNGGLTITSRPGEGTTVDLWLPISPVAPEEDRQADSSRNASKAIGTALLVDDEDLVRLSTAEMLMDLGYEVVEVPSAEEALRLMDEGLAPDLVVTDHLMPGLSGVDLARELQTRWPDLPVLIISGYAEMDGIAVGFQRLTKPFRAGELAAMLRDLRLAGAT